MDICARCAGGNNAGHTIVANIGPDNVKTKFDFHLLPSGLVNPRCVGFIGSGVVVHVPSFFSELDTLEKKGTSTCLTQASSAMTVCLCRTARTSCLTSTRSSMA